MLNYILDNSGGLPPTIKLGGVKSGLGDLFSSANTGLNSGVSGGLTSLTNSINSGAAQDDPLGVLSAAAGSIPIYGQFVKDGVAIAKLFGAGPEAWESVKSRAVAGTEGMIKKSMEILGTNPTVESIILKDKYLVLEIERLESFFRKYKSSNSKRSIRLQVNGLQKYRKEYAQKISNYMAVRYVESPAQGTGLKDGRGVDFPYYQMPQTIKHISVNPKSSPINLPPRPIQTITTPNGEVVDIPPKGVDTSYELKWWQYLLMAVPFLLAFLYYLIKKILKK
ncbi:hypothetical protein [Tenacibaculum maritimum]|uniref:hypothetical protein n=1 Tax=Tenacibaculum maritimum TaxID=107401 RepID=UPI003875E9DF